MLTKLLNDSFVRAVGVVAVTEMLTGCSSFINDTELLSPKYTCSNGKTFPLEKFYEIVDEKPVFTGTSLDGNYVVITANAKTGHWTHLNVDPYDEACVMDIGIDAIDNTIHRTFRRDPDNIKRWPRVSV